MAPAPSGRLLPLAGLLGAALRRAALRRALGAALGLVLGRIDFSSLFYVLDTAKGVPASLADAKTKGIPVIAYGQFVNDVISFLIVALAVFALVKQVNRLKREGPPPAPTTKDCPYCMSTINIKATRCPECTSELPPA